MKFEQIAAVAALATAHLSSAASVVVVTPTDVGTSPALNRWYLANFRDVSTGYAADTTAAITTTRPQAGNGSVEMSSESLGPTPGLGKADYVYSWGFVVGNTLGNLSALSFDWYRSSASTNSGLQQPALRLQYDADGDVLTTGDRGFLVWEQVYNGVGGANNAVAEVDKWVTSNILGGDFWQRQLSPGLTVEHYDTNLAEWAGGANPGNVADVLSANTAILGIEFGIGSGWSGNFYGAIDNVSYAFNAAEATTFNFEVAEVPEPGTVALGGLALAALALSRRRKSPR